MKIKADLLIRNGRLLDPAIGLDQKGDLAIKDGRILRLGAVDFTPALEMDAEGCLVTPGWIDCHGHLYEKGTTNGIPVDLVSIPMGTTAMADAGSTGVANYRGLLDYLRSAKVKCRMMLNVASGGIVIPSKVPESVDPATWEPEAIRDAIGKIGPYFMGLKIRISRPIVKDLSLEPLKRAVELAEELGCRVVVHATDPSAPMGEMAQLLRRDDIICHIYHGTGHTILDENARVDKKILQARERGVIMDAASGRGNFSFKVASCAIRDGFLPDSISTDITMLNWHHPYAGTLPAVMSKYLELGMNVPQIIERVTSGPALQLGIAGIGSLREGSCADLTVSKLEDADVSFVDREGTQIRCKKLFSPKATLIDGEILYRATDCPVAF
ncbi:MAG: amidohydrolase family protein [Oscillospiraceae bacterium]|nr:amidohydrolase family protein [Oscillospiraceae bacterium]